MELKQIILQLFEDDDCKKNCEIAHSIKKSKVFVGFFGE